MNQQIALDTHDEDLLVEEATDRDMAALVHDLSDELTVICAYANLGGDASYDAERTETYFALIESAGKKAAQITRQLLVVDLDRSSDDKPPASSFRRRLTAARAFVTS